MRNSAAVVLGAGTLLLDLGGVAIAATPAITDVITKRQANYKEIGGAFKGINDEIKSGSPDANTLRPLAKDLAARAAVTLKFFPRGSGPESGVKTRAKADIWASQAEFVGIQQKMIAAATQLSAAATAGDAKGVTAARDALGGTCKSCHERFRAPE
jgi:cytochrome c556